jgi:hypothetical protein
MLFYLRGTVRNFEEPVTGIGTHLGIWKNEELWEHFFYLWWQAWIRILIEAYADPKFCWSIGSAWTNRNVPVPICSVPYRTYCHTVSYLPTWGLCKYEVGLWEKRLKRQYRAFANPCSCTMLNQRRSQSGVCVTAQLVPITVRDGAVTLKGSHKMGDGRIFLKTSAPLSLMTTYRMCLILARSISLDSTFKGGV